MPDVLQVESNQDSKESVKSQATDIDVGQATYRLYAPATFRHAT
jgi:hypothetical protein